MSIRTLHDALQAHRIAPAIGIPVLVVHDLLDDEVPWDEGERFARHLTAARLLTTLDLGHHGVLDDPTVLRLEEEAAAKASAE